MDANGRPCGYDFEYLEAIAQYTGWKYEYVPVSIAEGIRRIVSGDLDIIGCMALDAERAKHMDYSEQPAGMGGNRLVSRMKDTRFAYGDLEALNGKTVGNLAGSTRYLRMKEYCHRHGFTVNFVEANTEKELFALLDEGKVDLVLWSQAWKMEGYRSVLDFDQRPFYFVVSKRSPEVLRQLDWAMGELRAVQPYYDSELRNKYFETYTKLSPSFTKKELEYIAAHREVSVSFDPDWYPIETLDRSSGTLGGIMKDVYELISRRTGITFRFVPRHSLADSQQQDSSTAQIHSLLCYDFSCSNAETMRFTQRYLMCSSNALQGTEVETPLHCLEMAP